VPWDRDSYRRNVLELARQAGNVPPADLYQRYGLPADTVGADAIGRRIAQVVAYWRELRSDRVLGPLAERLVVAHTEMERDGPLTAGKLARLSEEHRQQLREKLARQAVAIAGAATHAGPETVARLLGIFGGAVTRPEVEAALRDAGVEVVDTFPALPAVPHPQASALSQYVQQLGRQLSAEIVFGDDVRRGFRIVHGFQLSDGRSLDDATMDRARLEADTRAYTDPATSPTQKALTIMRTAAGQAGGLDALVLSEVVERLRLFVRRGLTAQRSVAAHAADLGLASDEAGLLAAAVLAEDTSDAVRRQIEEKFGARLLREAQRLAAGLPAGDPLRARVADADATVARLVQAADADQTAGRIEEAAERIAEAIALARDDDVLASRLSALPPPAPRAICAQPNGPGVLVTWEPSPARAGRVRYRVVRGEALAPVSAADGMTVVAHTEASSATDAQPPAGVRLRYSVFADRGGDVCSPPAEAPPLVFVPDVTSISVTEKETSVAVSWRVHGGAEGVRVVRREQRPGQEAQGPRDADDGTAMPASLIGFTDCGLRTGTEYLYRITAVYRAPDGRRRLSAGVVVSGTPEHEPDPVTDLAAEVPDADGSVASGVPVVLRWTPPRHGQVRLVRADHPPSWPAGMRAPPQAGLSEIPGEPGTAPDGRAILRVTLPFGLHYITPLTESGQATVAANTAKIRLVEPVRDPRAIRMSDTALLAHDTVLLTCAWPDDATGIIVRYPGGELTCSRRAYFEEGGLTVPVDRHAAEFWVVAAHHGPDGCLTAPPAMTSVPARPVAVHYEIRRPALRRRQRMVQVSAEETTRLPPLVMVQAAGSYAPAGPAEGQRIHETEGQLCQPGQPVRITVSLRQLRPGWLACFVDPDRIDPDADPVLLFHPPADQMRIP
jgi:hypothetical protein